jgi:hypothetical protein
MSTELNIKDPDRFNIADTTRFANFIGPINPEMDAIELSRLSPMFRYYTEHEPDLGSGLSPYWLWPQSGVFLDKFFGESQDPFYLAAVVHDFWYQHKWLARILGVTRARVDAQFVASIDRAIAEKPTYYRRTRGAIWKKIVLGAGPNLWSDENI